MAWAVQHGLAAAASTLQGANAGLLAASLGTLPLTHWAFAGGVQAIVDPAAEAIQRDWRRFAELVRHRDGHVAYGPDEIYEAQQQNAIAVLFLPAGRYPEVEAQATQMRAAGLVCHVVDQQHPLHGEVLQYCLGAILHRPLLGAEESGGLPLEVAPPLPPPPPPPPPAKVPAGPTPLPTAVAPLPLPVPVCNTALQQVHLQHQAELAATAAQYAREQHAQRSSGVAPQPSGEVAVALEQTFRFDTLGTSSGLDARLPSAEVPVLPSVTLSIPVCAEPAAAAPQPVQHTAAAVPAVSEVGTPIASNSSSEAIVLSVRHRGEKPMAMVTLSDPRAAQQVVQQPPASIAGVLVRDVELVQRDPNSFFILWEGGADALCEADFRNHFAALQLDGPSVGLVSSTECASILRERPPVVADRADAEAGVIGADAVGTFAGISLEHDGLNRSSLKYSLPAAPAVLSVAGEAATHIGVSPPWRAQAPLEHGPACESRPAPPWRRVLAESLGNASGQANEEVGGLVLIDGPSSSALQAVQSVAAPVASASVPVAPPPAPRAPTARPREGASCPGPPPCPPPCPPAPAASARAAARAPPLHRGTTAKAAKLAPVAGATPKGCVPGAQAERPELERDAVSVAEEDATLDEAAEAEVSAGPLLEDFSTNGSWSQSKTPGKIWDADLRPSGGNVQAEGRQGDWSLGKWIEDDVGETFRESAESGCDHWGLTKEVAACIDTIEHANGKSARKINAGPSEVWPLKGDGKSHAWIEGSGHDVQASNFEDARIESEGAAESGAWDASALQHSVDDQAAFVDVHTEDDVDAGPEQHSDEWTEGCAGGGSTGSDCGRPRAPERCHWHETGPGPGTRGLTIEAPDGPRDLLQDGQSQDGQDDRGEEDPQSSSADLEDAGAHAVPQPENMILLRAKFLPGRPRPGRQALSGPRPLREAAPRSAGRQARPSIGDPLASGARGVRPQPY